MLRIFLLSLMFSASSLPAAEPIKVSVIGLENYQLSFSELVGPGIVSPQRGTAVGSGAAARNKASVMRQAGVMDVLRTA